MTTDFYADVAADYDRMIRWERRLTVERPQFEALVKRHGIRSALDASCGSGHHLVLLASMGVAVEGSDASAAMIALARETVRKAGLSLDDSLHSLRWDELPAAIPRRFDAVFCIGNSLPYVMDPDDMAASVRGLWSRVADRGILATQYKNFEKLIASRERFLPLSSARYASSGEGGADPTPRETVALRMYDYHPDRIDFNVVLLDKRGDDWTMRHHVTPLRPYKPGEVAGVLEAEGASVSLHGSLGLEPFVAAESGDVVILAARG